MTVCIHEWMNEKMNERMNDKTERPRMNITIPGDRREDILSRISLVAHQIADRPDASICLSPSYNCLTMLGKNNGGMTNGFDMLVSTMNAYHKAFPKFSYPASAGRYW